MERLIGSLRCLSPATEDKAPGPWKGMVSEGVWPIGGAQLAAVSQNPAFVPMSSEGKGRRPSYVGMQMVTWSPDFSHPNSKLLLELKPVN